MPDFLLIGDSHAAAIGRAARAAGTAFVGGPIGAARDFFTDFFAVEHGRLRFRGDEAERLHRRFLDELAVASLADLRIPVVATIGFGLHFPAVHENWRLYLDDARDGAGRLVGDPVFAAVVDAMTEPAVAFYRELVAMGLRVLAVLPPQRVPDIADATVFRAAQAQLIARLQAIGVEAIDVRAATCGPDGFVLPRFAQERDPLHGSLAFGALVVDAVQEALVR